MRRVVALLITLCVALAIAGCQEAAPARGIANPIKTYIDIPGITQDEIIAIERLKETRGRFTFGHMTQSESFLQPDGTYAGYTLKLCSLLTELFGIDFAAVRHDNWESLKDGLDAMEIDFTGGMTPTPERRKSYLMTYPIAERQLRIFTLAGSGQPEAERDINGYRIGFLSDTITYEYVCKYYPELTFERVDVDNQHDAVQMLESGEIDAFVCDATIDPSFEEYESISSKVFFPLVYTPVSMTTANSDLQPIISVMDKYISAGGIDRLIELYKEGEFEYSSYKLYKSFTPVEKAYLDRLSQNRATVRTGFEAYNYPLSFYNETTGRFEGIASDVLEEISRLTGLTFEPVGYEGESWASIFERLRTGEASMVTELLYSEARKNNFLWTDSPYAESYYALLSKSDYPNLSKYQVVRTRVGVMYKSAYQDVYNDWFPDNNNLITYETMADAFDALEKGEIDLLMASEHTLLYQTNYREKPEYKINMSFNAETDSFFGFNRDEATLRSIVNKAQAYVDVGFIETTWLNRTFDYSKKLDEERMSYMTWSVIILIAVLAVISVLFLKYVKAANDARSASRAKSEFLSRMSHEIRTPLNAIIGMAGIAKASVHDREKTVSSINRIISSSSHLLSMLNDVLDMSSMESGNLRLSHEPFSFLEAYQELNGIIEQHCSEKGISYKTNVDSVKDMILIGDMLRVNQILINLLGNAVKFTDEGGEVSLTASVLEEDKKSVRISFSISDTGIGMTKEEQDHLFIAFEQTDGSIASQYGGMGLGLSISQKLVNKMGGCIKVESTQGIGTRFYFDILFDKGALTEERQEQAADPARLDGRRILLVDDVEINRMIVHEILAAKGAEVVEAENGQRAIEAFGGSDTGFFDFIFMDIQMPVMDGYQSTSAIRALKRGDSKSIPIVALTANTYDDNIDKALAAGMNALLPKPVDPEMLVKIVNESTNR